MSCRRKCAHVSCGATCRLITHHLCSLNALKKYGSTLSTRSCSWRCSDLLLWSGDSAAGSSFANRRFNMFTLNAQWLRTHESHWVHKRPVGPLMQATAQRNLFQACDWPAWLLGHMWWLMCASCVFVFLFEQRFPVLWGQTAALGLRRFRHFTLFGVCRTDTWLGQSVFKLWRSSLHQGSVVCWGPVLHRFVSSGFFM